MTSRLFGRSTGPLLLPTHTRYCRWCLAWRCAATATLVTFLHTHTHIHFAMLGANICRCVRLLEILYVRSAANAVWVNSLARGRCCHSHSLLRILFYAIRWVIVVVVVVSSVVDACSCSCGDPQTFCVKPKRINTQSIKPLPPASKLRENSAEEQAAEKFVKYYVRPVSLPWETVSCPRTHTGEHT